MAIVVAAAMGAVLPFPAFVPDASAQILDKAGRALSPEEARQLDNEIAKLQKTTRLQAATIAGIARALKQQYSNVTGDRMIQLVRQQVYEAEKWRAAYGRLEENFAAIGNEELAARYRARLDEAKSAFDDGELLEAGAMLDSLLDEIGASKDITDRLWLDTVNVRGDLSLLSGRFDEAAEFRIAMAKLEERRSILRRWDLYHRAGFDMRVKAIMLGDNGAAMRAIKIYRDLALAEVDPERFPEQWASSRVDLAGAIQEAAERGYFGDRMLEKYSEVRDILKDVTSERYFERGSRGWLEARIQYAGVLGRHSEPNARQRDPTLDSWAVNLLAIELVTDAVEQPELARYPVLLAGALNEYGMRLKTAARYCADCDFVELYRDAEDQFELALSVNLPPYYRGVDMSIMRVMLLHNLFDTRRNIVYRLDEFDASEKIEAIALEQVAVNRKLEKGTDVWWMTKLSTSVSFEEAAQKAKKSERKSRLYARALAELGELREQGAARANGTLNLFLSDFEKDIARSMEHDGLLAPELQQQAVVEAKP